MASSRVPLPLQRRFNPGYKRLILVPIRKETEKFNKIESLLNFKMSSSEFCEVLRIFSKSIENKLTEHYHHKSKFLTKLAAGKLFANTLDQLKKNANNEDAFKMNFETNYIIVEIEEIGEIQQLPKFKTRYVFKAVELEFADHKRNEIQIFAENEVGSFVQNIFKVGDILLVYKDNKPLIDNSNILRIGGISGNTLIILYPKLQEFFQIPLLSFRIKYWFHEVGAQENDKSFNQPNSLVRSLLNKEVTYVKKGYRTLLASRKISQVEHKTDRSKDSPRVIAVTRNGSEPLAGTNDSLIHPGTPAPAIPKPDEKISTESLDVTPDNPPGVSSNAHLDPPSDDPPDVPSGDLPNVMSDSDDHLDIQNGHCDVENRLPAPSTPKVSKSISNLINSLSTNVNEDTVTRVVGLFEDYPIPSESPRVKKPNQESSTGIPMHEEISGAERVPSIPFRTPIVSNSTCNLHEISPSSSCSSPNFDLDFEISPSTKKEMAKEITAAPDDSTPIKEGIRQRDERKRKANEPQRKKNELKPKRKPLKIKFNTQEDL